MVEDQKKTVGKSFFSGVLLLTTSTVLVKLIGLFYKIPMLAYLGSEGMGYFNSAYEIYALFCVIATAGLPVAVSVLISGAIATGNGWRVRKIYRASMMAFLLIGSLGTLIMAVFARQFCQWIKSENAYSCILSIAPTVFFVCISSAIRGYFQGYQRMLPTALSQLIESAGKLVFGLLLARWALHKGYTPSAVAGFAGLGLSFGTLLSTLYLIIEKLRFCPVEEIRENDTVSSYRGVWSQLSGLAIPMTLGAALISITKLVDMTMILRRLQSIGFSEVAANEAYGSYTTLALSVFGLLPSLVNGIALPLVPMLSAAIAAGDEDRQVQSIRMCYRLIALISMPSALGITAFAHPLLTLLFGYDPVAVSVAAPLLSALGISVFLSCMITATNSVLHGYSKVKSPILSMVLGAGVKIVFAYAFIGNPRIGMMGAPISTFLCNGIIVMTNLFFASRLCHVPGVPQILGRPLAASLLSVGMGLMLYQKGCGYIENSSAWVLACIGVVVALYTVFACLLGAIEREDVLSLPMGNLICRALTFFRLLKK